ncbi:MAG: YihA family ribosome biogenesis GTP-binding protein [Methylophilales bacterium]|jgi:GTP-binding protein|nr:ribosome biogenesis GTP-binding protein YihA/YsxC [Pseudomonadota bacterium]NQW35102.1 YihA family ribosome biogenesis GTP-binding protein [Methylophilales bacterium]HCK04506.1 YihA family ribosome biogenesis GTP-binding protein [Methylophilaceae bacterium]|tara:strand:+ start:330 stop:944 length:615 start_codon:yes stop_codon:yes gene_type:complete
MALLQNAKFVISANHFNELPEDTGYEIAFAGRSNAGKSSAINTLSNQTRLAYVSKQPGRTQLINFFRIDDDKSLVDLPGYGYAKVPSAIRDHWQKTLPRYLQERESLVGLIIVMDIRRPLTDLDIKMLDWFSPRQKPIHILLTKSDKLSRDQSLRTLSDIKGRVKAQWGDLYQTECTVQLFSSLKKTGVEEADNMIQSWLLPNK